MQLSGDETQWVLQQVQGLEEKKKIAPRGWAWTLECPDELEKYAPDLRRWLDEGRAGCKTWFSLLYETRFNHQTSKSYDF